MQGDAKQRRKPWFSRGFFAFWPGSVEVDGNRFRAIWCKV
jgi:hypothetical protein